MEPEQLSNWSQMTRPLSSGAGVHTAGLGPGSTLPPLRIAASVPGITSKDQAKHSAGSSQASWFIPYPVLVMGGLDTAI